MGKVAAIAAALLLAGCAARAVQDQLTFCDGAQPLRPAPGETAKLADRTVAQIRQHNRLGAEVCGWKP